ncbi:MAG: rRNA maturation RNase YbeY [Cyclobacteriaceae bacterium]
MISFFTEDITFDTGKTKSRKAWIKSIIEQEGFQPGDINYIFCSDEYLWKINMEYLNHDTYTDIITFDQSESEKEISGDIYISIERLEEKSRDHRSPFDDELDRLLIHGILHLCGYSDHSQEEKNLMRKKEDACLSLR